MGQDASQLVVQVGFDDGEELAVGGDGRTLEPVHDPHPDGTMLRPPLVWAMLFPEIGYEGQEWSAVTFMEFCEGGGGDE